MESGNRKNIKLKYQITKLEASNKIKQAKSKASNKFKSRKQNQQRQQN